MYKLKFPAKYCLKIDRITTLNSVPYINLAVLTVTRCYSQLLFSGRRKVYTSCFQNLVQEH